MTSERHLSTFHLDALEIGVLSDAEQTAARTHLGACARCRADLEETRAAAERFRVHVFPRTAGRLTRARSIAGWKLALGAALAAAVAIVLFVRMRPRDPDAAPRDEGPVLAVKGGPSLRAFALRDQRVFAVREGMRLVAGDRLRFVVEPAGLPYLLVASVDGDGKVSVYYPERGDQSGRLPSEMRNELPDSIRLDAAAGPERVFALFSRAPLPVEPVRRALQAVGARGGAAIRFERTLSVGADAQVTVMFEKEAL